MSFEINDDLILDQPSELEKEASYNPEEIIEKLTKQLFEADAFIEQMAIALNTLRKALKDRDVDCDLVYEPIMKPLLEFTPEELKARNEDAARRRLARGKALNPEKAKMPSLEELEEQYKSEKDRPNNEIINGLLGLMEAMGGRLPDGKVTFIPVPMPVKEKEDVSST